MIYSMRRAIDAVVKDGTKLAEVHTQNVDICKLAVSQAGNALQYVKNQNMEIILAALFNNPLALEYVVHQTMDICSFAVERDGKALQYVDIENPIQYSTLCLLAIRQNGWAFTYVDKSRLRMEGNIKLLNWDLICMEALYQNPYCIEQMEERTVAMEELAVSLNPHVLEVLPNPSPELLIMGVKKAGELLRLVNYANQTYDMCKEAVANYPMAIKYVNSSMRGYGDLCQMAMDLDRDTKEFCCL